MSLDLIGPSTNPVIEEYWMLPYGKTMRDFLNDYNIQLVDKDAHFNRFVPLNFEEPGFLECAWVCEKVEDGEKNNDRDYYKEWAISDIANCIGKRAAKDMVEELLNNRRKYGVK